MPENAPAVGELGRHEAAVSELIARARREIPFYAEMHTGLTSTTLADQPTCTKADLTGFGPLPLTGRPLSDMAWVSATSGTTGPRLFIGYSYADWEALGEQYVHIAEALGLTPDDVLMNTHGAGLWIGHPSLNQLAHAAGAGVVPVGPTNASQVMTWLHELPVTLISATPSFMRVLVETAGAAGQDLSAIPLRLGLLGGEGAPPALRRQVVAGLPENFRWQDMYGSTETAGPILAFGDPTDQISGGVLNINTDYFVIELLKPDVDEPVEPGEVGEITLTTPYREGSPLIRYRTRDLTSALVGQRGPSGLPLVKSLLGRIDDAMKVRGTLVYPSAIDDLVVRTLPPGAEWRIVLTREVGGNDVMTIHVELDDGDQVKELGADIRHRTQVRPVMKMVGAGSLQRFDAKAKRVIDQRSGV
ncbi:MAG: phenylacetate--CoA ligase [Actinomycetia bacterium]|nr:phenylacetate--CoA ligase [Actinomycetes bacterium]